MTIVTQSIASALRHSANKEYLRNKHTTLWAKNYNRKFSYERVTAIVRITNKPHICRKFFSGSWQWTIVSTGHFAGMCREENYPADLEARKFIRKLNKQNQK